MLAQNFKTAEELDLTDAEHRALVVVLGMLERGEIEQRSAKLADHYHGSDFVPASFNMRYFAATDDCGTISCICGWAEHVGGLPSDSLMKKRLNVPALNDLFDPTGTYESDNITPEEAAAALRNYLTDGEPRWAQVMDVHT